MMFSCPARSCLAVSEGLMSSSFRCRPRQRLRSASRRFLDVRRYLCFLVAGVACLREWVGGRRLMSHSTHYKSSQGRKRLPRNSLSDNMYRVNVTFNLIFICLVYRHSHFHRLKNARLINTIKNSKLQAHDPAVSKTVVA